jgi:tetratricopeptide (TPR) repeat protein
LSLIAVTLGACTDADEEPTDPIGRAAQLARELTESEAAERLGEAEQALARRDFEGAVELLQPVVSRADVSTDAYRLYGQALLGLERASLAIWPLARAAADAEPDSVVASDYARALLRGGDAEASLQLLDALLERAPDSADLHRLRAQAHRRRLDHESALEDIEAVLDLDPNDLSSFEVRVQLLEELELLDEARAALAALSERTAERGAPTAVRARYCAAAAHFEQRHDNPEGARAHFEACLAQYPLEADVVVPWSEFLAEQGDAEAAIAVLREAASGLGRFRQRIRIALGDRYVAVGRREEAVAEFERAAEDLNSPDPLIALADHRMAWNDVEGARDAVEAAIARLVGRAPSDPDFAWSSLEARLRFVFGDILIRTRQLERVDEVVASLEADGEEEVYPLLLRARLALERRDPATALELFDESFKIWPSNVGARYLAGRAAMELGEFDRGLSLYQDAFRAAPAESDAGLVLARLQASQGLVVAAAQTLSTLLGNVEEPMPEALRLLANVATNLAAFETSKATRAHLAMLPGWADEALADQAAEVLAREGFEAAIAELEAGGCLVKPDHPESLGLWVRLQREFAQDGGAQARSRVLEMAKATPEDASIAFVEALVHRLDQDLDSAETAARRAFDLDPSRAESGLALGRVLVDLTRWDEAEAVFREVLAIDPQSLGAAMGLADATIGAGRIEEAEGLYHEALVTHPWHGRAARALARIALDREVYDDQAVIWARWSARFNEGESVSAAAALLAEMRLARKEFEEARVALVVASEASEGPDARLAYLRARALEGLGRREQAIASLVEALEVGPFPEREEAMAMLADLRGRSGD